ncbi:MAG: hypothetical protein H2172_09255 [Opitutus sp.]|nr:hypothetical protein [Opitutus sp.]MCS6247000.1 hypothetical protein [Opitutus sp.]MCS6273224.1 hypothetical protein [Opitutus sp.]MCS6276542.1 hypothetical protein [Opitutus sp.]MCS6301810.1 hypothetical protein [Opitutus sp.]
MTTPEPSESGKVSLGELLRLKRAERPEPEFWARFEQDLRAKQLAAIVEKRPWWVALRLPLATRALSRWTVQLPLGAAAVLVLSFVVVREDHPHAAVVAPAARAEVRVATATILLPQRAPEVPAVVAQQSVAAPVSEPLADVGAGLASGVSPKSEVALTQESAAVSAVAVVATVAPADPAAEVGLTLAAAPGVVRELTASPVSGVELSPVAFEVAATAESGQGFDTGFENEGLSAKFAQIRAEVGASRATPTSPREVRRGRILASLVLADNSTEAHRLNSGYAREVLARPLGDEPAYDGLSRIGMGGDRLTLKF